jgi:radical SAM protein with 4Fe4S-binding SPASM domain
MTRTARNRLPGPLVLIPQHFGSLVFDRRTSRYLPFDRQGTELLLRLRSAPLGAVLHKLPEQERPQVERFFAHFHSLGFFTLAGRFDGQALELEPPEDHLAGPLAVHLEVVAACNLTCRHCFAGVLPRRETPLTLDELDALFGQMAALGAFRLGLTGGEPLLRRDLFEILDLATAHGLHPCLTTNGLLITEEIARELGRRDLVWLNVSLEGATAATNDAIRGPGVFERVLKRLEVLARHARFTLAFTITRQNLPELRACAELAARVGAHTAVFRPLYPVGVAREHLDLMPTFAEYTAALDLLAGLKDQAHFDFNPIDPFSPHLRREKQAVTHANYGCGAGNLVCSISVSGEVNPCSFLGPEFNGGSIRERPLADIWHDSHVFRAMRGMRVEEPASAHGTTARFTGGCRARALILNGSVAAPDPWVTAHAELEQASGAARRNPLVVLEVR